MNTADEELSLLKDAFTAGTVARITMTRSVTQLQVYCEAARPIIGSSVNCIVMFAIASAACVLQLPRDGPTMPEQVDLDNDADMAPTSDFSFVAEYVKGLIVVCEKDGLC